MGTYRPTRFTKPGVLKKIEPALLHRFLLSHGEHLRSRGVDLGVSEGLDYDALVRVFMNPEDDYPALAGDLYVIDEMASSEWMNLLLAAAEERGTPVDGSGGFTPAEVALRLWLDDRDLVERKHAESFISRVRSFEYSLARRTPTTRYQHPSGERIRALEQDLDDWFDKKGRGRECQVLVFEKEDATWFLVRHGEPLRREGTMDEGDRTVVVYRPEKYNVLVLEPTRGELGINAPSKGEKDLYRKKFGLHLFGDEQFFSEPGRYSLEPLRDDGEESLFCGDVEDLAWVKLREVRFFWGGAAKEVEIRKASDIFEIYKRGNRTMPRAPLIQAKFEVQFGSSKKSRMLTIRPPSTAYYTRDSDKGLLEEWMQKRGFLRLGPDLADVDAES
jgi:hypothetical protein